MSIKTYSKSKIIQWIIIITIAFYFVISQITGSNIIFHTIYYFSNPDKRIVINQNYSLELPFEWSRKNKFLLEHIFLNESILLTESCTENEVEKYSKILYEMCDYSDLEVTNSSLNHIVTQEYTCKKVRPKYEQNEYKFIYMPSINSCFLASYLGNSHYGDVMSTIKP